MPRPYECLPFKAADGEAKQRYREAVWQAVDDLLDWPRGSRRVAILDTGKGLETKHLLSLGYRADRIHVVNDQPQHIAWVRRRYPRVMVHSGDLAAVLPTLPAPDVLNYDGMGVVGSRRMPRTVRQIVPVLAEDSIFAITIMGSREIAAKEYVQQRQRHLVNWAYYNPELTYADRNRLDYVLALVEFAGQHVERVRAGRYLSGHLPMLWMVMQLGTGPYMRVF